MRALALALMLPIASAPGDSVVAVESTTDCQDYVPDYRLVTKVLLAKLNADRKNLAKCEPALQEAATELTEAAVTLTTAKADLKALHTAATEQRAVIAELKAQKQVLQGHITKLESLTCPEPSVATALVNGWEEVDGTLALGAGYTLGTGMCVALAWVFNQPALQR